MRDSRKKSTASICLKDLNLAEIWPWQREGLHDWAQTPRIVQPEVLWGQRVCRRPVHQLCTVWPGHHWLHRLIHDVHLATRALTGGQAWGPPRPPKTPSHWEWMLASVGNSLNRLHLDPLLCDWSLDTETLLRCLPNLVLQHHGDHDDLRWRSLLSFLCFLAPENYFSHLQSHLTPSWDWSAWKPIKLAMYNYQKKKKMAGVNHGRRCSCWVSEHRQPPKAQSKASDVILKTSRGEENLGNWNSVYVSLRGNEITSNVAYDIQY